MTYNFTATPAKITGDKVIATALDGVVYSENNRLHVKGNKRHVVYKYDGSPVGWYARNIKNNDDIYLGDGASPTIEFENLEIKDAETWAAIEQPANDETDGEA